MSSKRLTAKQRAAKTTEEANGEAKAAHVQPQRTSKVPAMGSKRLASKQRKAEEKPHEVAKVAHVQPQRSSKVPAMPSKRLNSKQRKAEEKPHEEAKVAHMQPQCSSKTTKMSLTLKQLQEKAEEDAREEKRLAYVLFDFLSCLIKKSEKNKEAGTTKDDIIKLIQGVIDASIEPSDFLEKIRRLMNHKLDLDFMEKSLPVIRVILLKNNTSITTLSASRALMINCCLPGASIPMDPMDPVDPVDLTCKEELPEAN